MKVKSESKSEPAVSLSGKSHMESGANRVRPKHVTGADNVATGLVILDGGTPVSPIRVTAPIGIAGQRGKIVFIAVPSRHPY